MVDKKIDVDVEILFQIDNGEITIGQKRNDLLSRARGEYLCFIDDDDRISSNYISLVLESIETKPDCCSLIGLITTDGGNAKNFIHSIKYNNWYEENNIYYRPPNHLNCIKSQIAKQFKFPCISNGEDKDWSMQIAQSGLLKKEYEIKETIYFYDYLSNK
jgi:glycosyltransferase involved in cell wall biosynthesis